MIPMISTTVLMVFLWSLEMRKWLLDQGVDGVGGNDIGTLQICQAKDHDILPGNS